MNQGNASSRLAGRAVVALVLAGAIAGTAIAATSVANNKARAEKLKLGERLTYVGGCNDCHTPGTFYGNADAKRRLSGSELGWEGPWGVTYPRNLTPDMETGIGKWTEDDIVRAIRTGVRPDKSPLLPPMPWPMYAHMTDQEAYAVAAYLKSMPPVKHKVPDRQPANGKAIGARLTFPPPPAWDMQHAVAAAK
jgi:mono/diheme cytochrome c family protein